VNLGSWPRWSGRYWAEIDAFNVSGFNPVTGQYRSDKKSDAVAAATYEKTLLAMVGVPARTREDALAALDWLIKEGTDLDELNQGDWNPFCKVAGSLVMPSEAISKGGWHEGL